jgi:integrase
MDSLDGFEEWLLTYGSAQSTASLYVHNVKRAYELGGPLERLSDDELAPKTRRHILAACRAWAEYTEDEKLTKRLGKLKLPADERSTARVPIPRDEWLELMEEVDRADYITEPMRAELGMLGRRGFRRGDVLRLRRREVLAGLKTGTLAYEAKGKRRLEFRVLTTFRGYLEILADHRGWERVRDLIAPRGRSPQAAGKAVIRALGRCAGQVGLEDVYPHRLRRTYATEFLRQLQGDAEALIKLKEHMQWRSLATAMEYVDHVRGEELDEVAERIFC